MDGRVLRCHEKSGGGQYWEIEGLKLNTRRAREEKLTFLSERYKPTHSPDSTRNGDNALEADAAAQPKFDGLLGRDDEEVVKGICERVDEERVGMKGKKMDR
jgi:hypothetical protein